MDAREARRIASESEMGEIYSLIRIAAESGNFFCKIYLNDDQRNSLMLNGYTVEQLTDSERTMMRVLGNKRKLKVMW